MQKAKYNIGQVVFHVSAGSGEGGWAIGAVAIIGVKYESAFGHLIYEVCLLDDVVDVRVSEAAKNRITVFEETLFNQMSDAIRYVHKNIATGIGYPYALDAYYKTDGLIIDDLIKWEDDRDKKNAKREEELSNIANEARSINHPEGKEAKQ